MVWWKVPIEGRQLSARGRRGDVPVPGTAYGDGEGFPVGFSVHLETTAAISSCGTGQQHRPTVHVADVADSFRRALENDQARGYSVLGNGARSTVAELTGAAAVAADSPGAVPGSEDEARQRLGWAPTHPPLVDDVRHGSYRP